MFQALQTGPAEKSGATGILARREAVPDRSRPAPLQPCEVFVRELDTRGLACPMPLLKAKQALNTMASGETLRVQATDRGSWRDFRAFAEQSGHALLECNEVDGVFIYVLRKR